MHIKKVIFDFDGVFVDTLEHSVKEIKTIARVFGKKEPTKEEIAGDFSLIFVKVLEKYLPGITLEMYLQKRKELGLNRILPPKIPGAYGTVKYLKSELAMSIISNREVNSLYEILIGCGFDREDFQYIQSCSDYIYHKPDPRVFRKILIAVDSPREKIMYVGDHITDYQAAKGAGICFVGVLTGHITTKEEFVREGLNPEFILESIAELPKFLNRYQPSALR